MSKEGAILARNLKRIAKERNLTQREMAAICKIDEAVMSRYFNNKQYPQGSRLVKMAKDLEVTVEELLT